MLINPVYNVNEGASHGANIHSKLNEKQKLVVNKIMWAIAGETIEKLFFLEAAAECSMSYVFANILNIVREQAHLALATKWTCKSAQFLAACRSYTPLVIWSSCSSVAFFSFLH